MGITLEEILKRIDKLAEDLEYFITCKGGEISQVQQIELAGSLALLKRVAGEIQNGN